LLDPELDLHKNRQDDWPLLDAWSLLQGKVLARTSGFFDVWQN